MTHEAGSRLRSLNHSSSLSFLNPASDRGREKNGKLRPKSEGFELYNNSVQNGSPESPQAGWDSYPEPKKMSGEDRLLKNRADHRSSPNVASKCSARENASTPRCAGKRKQLVLPLYPAP